MGSLRCVERSCHEQDTGTPHPKNHHARARIGLREVKEPLPSPGGAFTGRRPCPADRRSTARHAAAATTTTRGSPRRSCMVAPAGAGALRRAFHARLPDAPKVRDPRRSSRSAGIPATGTHLRGPHQIQRRGGFMTGPGRPGRAPGQSPRGCSRQSLSAHPALAAEPGTCPGSAGNHP